MESAAPQLDYFKTKENENLVAAREKMSGKTIVTGLDLYDHLKQLLLGDLNDRNFVRNYESFLSEKFFAGQAIALIPRYQDDTISIKVGDERERPIQSLGEGLQQLIILTLPIFEHQDKPLFLFIEEPDIYLHPGFQRILIETILENSNANLYVFAATHSNQFLDITVSENACAIFRFTKYVPEAITSEYDPKFSIESAMCGDHSLLAHIGVRPSSVMLANCTIWVEGITDRLYLGRYIEILLKSKGLNYVENLHFAFVEYGGNNITHWSFLDEENGMNVERLCARLFLIADKDKGKEARHDKLAETLKERFYVLKVREIENLLTPEVITKVIEDFEGKIIPMKSFSAADYASVSLGLS